MQSSVRITYAFLRLLSSLIRLFNMKIITTYKKYKRRYDKWVEQILDRKEEDLDLIKLQELIDYTHDGEYTNENIRED